MTRLIGTTVEPCILVLNGALKSPAGIFVHNDTTIYWTNYYDNSAFVGTISGNIISSQSQLVGGIFDLPNGISVDHVDKKIYWANQELDIFPPPAPSDGPLVGHIYVGDFSDFYISNPRFLNIPSDKLSGPNGIFIDHTQNPKKFYWTNYLGNTMYVGDLSDETVTGVQALTGLVRGVTLEGPSSIFIDLPTNEIYWTNYDNNTVFVGHLDGAFISDIHPITGANFDGPNGIFLTSGTLDQNDITSGVCDITCGNCIRMFMQFSDLQRAGRPVLDLRNSDDRNLLGQALSLETTYCFRIDWRNSSQMFGSAKEILQIINASDSTLDPLMLEFKQSLLNARKVPDCCDAIPEALL